MAKITITIEDEPSNVIIRVDAEGLNEKVTSAMRVGASLLEHLENLTIGPKNANKVEMN